MGVLLAAVALSSRQVPAADVDLVYDARYYFQGKKRSHHQIYLVRHDGKHKFQVTHGDTDCLAPVWIGKETIAYLEVLDKGRWSDDLPKPQKVRVVTYSLRTGRTKVVAPQSLPPTSDFVGHPEGVITTADDDSSHVVYDGRRPPSAESFRAQERYTFHTTGQYGLDGKMVVGTKGGDTTLEWQNREPLVWEQAETISIKSTCGGASRTYALLGDIVVNGFLDKDASLILLTGTAWTKFTWATYLYRIDLPTGHARMLVDRVGAATIVPGSDYWLGHQETAPRAFLKKLDDGRQVYCNWLYAGNWRTGQRWKVAEGLVNVGSANLRPSQ